MHRVRHKRAGFEINLCNQEVDDKTHDSSNTRVKHIFSALCVPEHPDHQKDEGIGDNRIFRDEDHNGIENRIVMR